MVINMKSLKMVKNAIFLLILISTLFACDGFMESMGGYIEEATGLARVVGFKIAPDSFKMSGGVTAVPMGSEIVITANIRNPQNYDLEFGLQGYNEGDKAEICPTSTNSEAIIRIIGIAHEDNFDLTLTIVSSEIGREMPPFELPKMQARFFEKQLSGLSLTAGSTTVPLAFDPAVASYRVNLEPETELINLSTVFVPQGDSSYAVSSGNFTRVVRTDSYIFPIPVSMGANTITIEVTADNGDRMVYSISANVPITGKPTFDITYEKIIDAAPTLETGVELSRADKEEVTFDVSGFDSVQWIYDGAVIGSANSRTITLDPANANYIFDIDRVGEHLLTVNVRTGTTWYNKTISFEVTE